jgi:pimeloyl-ACP methyl ester carboxylesterase
MMAILHEPDRPREPRVGISLLNPGLKYRVAPNRLNVRLARRFAEMGFYVLRLDPPGIGDSGGSLPERSLQELWAEVEHGALVEGVQAAHKVFRKACGLSEIIAAGNCGGAITALLACAGDPICRRLILMDVPVATKGAGPRPAERIRGREHGSWVLASYFRRMSDWRAWLKLVTLRSDVKLIARALWARFGPARQAVTDQPPVDTAAEPGGGDDEHLNESFVGAFETFDARGGTVLFVNSEMHVSLVHFESLFASRFLVAPERARRHPRHTVRGANHIFGMPEWRDELFGIVTGWLDRPNATPVRATASAPTEARGEVT